MNFLKINLTEFIKKHNNKKQKFINFLKIYLIHKEINSIK